MQIRKNKLESRNVTKKDVIAAVIVVVFCISAIVIGKLYSKTITVIMFSILALVAIVQYFRLPKKQKSAIAEAMEEHDKTYIGRLMKIVHYAIYLAICVSIIIWIVKKIK